MMRFSTLNILYMLLLTFTLACNDETQIDNDSEETINQSAGDVGTDEDADAAAEPDNNGDADANADLDSGPDENLLFADDFSTGDLSSHNQYFRWGQGGVRGPGSNSGKIEMVEGPDGSEVQAMRFRYIGTNEGGSGDDAHWSKQRFALTETVDEERGRNQPSDTIYPEVWISFWLYVPDNYNHTLKNGTIAGSNQKGWLFLWKDLYSNYSEDLPEQEMTPTTAAIGWWPVTEDEGREDYGMSRNSLTASRHNSGRGHNGNPTFVREEEQVLDSSQSYTFLQSEHGTWVHYIFGASVATDEESQDGFVRIYKNDGLAIAWEDHNGSSNYPESNGFDRGYLLGYHNAAYEETTTYYLTDFKFGLTREAVRP